MGLRPSQIHCTASPMVSSLSRSYSDNDTCDSSFVVSYGEDKNGVGPSTTQVSSNK